MRYQAALMKSLARYLSSGTSWLGDNYRQHALILSNAGSSSYSFCFFFFFIKWCSSACSRSDGTKLMVTACQIDQNMRSRGGCTEVPRHCFQSRSKWASAGSLCWRRWSHHLHIGLRVQGKDIVRLLPSRINVPINCYYISVLWAFFYPVVLLVRLQRDAKSDKKNRRKDPHHSTVTGNECWWFKCNYQFRLCGWRDFFFFWDLYLKSLL